MYLNPILYADYSDPDVIRVGEDFYMVASSFTYLPGVPIFHSRDLVHWELINYGVSSLPSPRYDVPRHGSGTWAPSIRYHEGMYYIFIPLPDEGIYVARSKDIRGQFQLNCLVQAKGWIDPCPLWDEDGRAYMVFAYANSRCGKKHRLAVVEIDPECTRLLGDVQEVFHREDIAPTIEGPKLYKKDGLYYIFAPAGGVEQGWQAVLRSQSIWGPYEYKVVLQQGNTSINGPHQGGWVTAPDGSDWFVHFQDVIELGRITHLQPMYWQNGWPVIGNRGEPVPAHSLPVSHAPQYAIPQSDDFSNALGIQWQWQANPRSGFYELAKSGLRLFCLANQQRENLLWYAPNALTQIPQHKSFCVQTTLTLHANQPGDFASIGMLGHRYAYLSLEAGYLRLYTGKVTEIQDLGNAEEILAAELPYPHATVFLRLVIPDGRTYRFFWSTDAVQYYPIGEVLALHRATWTGAKLCLWAANRENRHSHGFGEFARILIVPMA